MSGMSVRGERLLLAALVAVGIGCKSKQSASGDQPAAEPPAPPAVPVAAPLASAPGGPAPAEAPAEAEDCAPTPSLADCPLAQPGDKDLDQLLDTAGASLDKGALEEAFACADIAADLVPNSVEAQHLRAAALAELGRYEEAQTAFALALALDPDDPETLAASAHFYINVLPDKRRETTLVGLEYARRGSARAAARWRRDRELRARLALLEAEALDDLGRADEALVAVDHAISLAPDFTDALHERGVALFNLCRIDEARASFAAVLRHTPDDPYAHHYLGLVYERWGRDADARAQFARAHKLSPDEFPEPVDISMDEFRAELDRAIAELDPKTRALLTGVKVEAVEIPSLDDLAAVTPPFAPTILGLFRGLPLGADDEPGAPHRTIQLYRRNLIRAVRSRGELDRQIRRTLLHEIGHLQGFDEDELRRRGLD